MKYLIRIVSIIGLFSISQLAYPADITDTYNTGDTLTSTTMNNIKSAVNDNDSRITALEAALSALQATVASLQSDLSTHASQISAINSSSVMDLDPYITVTSIGGAKATLSGINLQIVNGLGSTTLVNGLGNLIVGYDEANTLIGFHCSFGFFTNQTDCVNSFQTWSNSHKSGSHNLVLGSFNSYSQYGGMVAGQHNFITNAFSTVTGGDGNIARGNSSSVSGGGNNDASGLQSSISGGGANNASGVRSSVSGGSFRSSTGTDDWRAGSLFENF